jgi:hypothetical protein
LVSFAAGFQLSRIAIPLFRNGNSTESGSETEARNVQLNLEPTVKQVLSCQPSLGKIGNVPGTAAGSILQYYDTYSGPSFIIPPWAVADQSASVGQVTYASMQF